MPAFSGVLKALTIALISAWVDAGCASADGVIGDVRQVVDDDEIGAVGDDAAC